MSLSFNDYFKKLEALGENAPQIFKKVAKKGAIHARNEAVSNTDRLGLVDTGAYRRNWNGEAVQFDKNTYGITLQNSMEYASWLEEGHGLRGINENRKYKIKRPDNIDVPKVRYKGFFVGKLAMTDLEGWAILELQEELDIAMKAKKYGMSKSEVRKMNK